MRASLLKFCAIQSPRHFEKFYHLPRVTPTNKHVQTPGWGLLTNAKSLALDLLALEKQIQMMTFQLLLVSG